MNNIEILVRYKAGKGGRKSELQINRTARQCSVASEETQTAKAGGKS